MSENHRSIFSGIRILVQHEFISQHALVVEHGKIQAIIPEHMIQHHLPAQHYHYASNCYLIPGMIDLHIHGARGRDVMDADLSGYKEISRALAEEGVTGFLATTMTASKESIGKVLAIVPQAMTQQQGAAILGVHLEGPFIAAEKLGAQNAEFALLPDFELIKEWQQLAQGAIKLITLAPELPGAVEFISRLGDLGIIAAAGHTNATYEEIQAAIKAGCKYATHLFNAMRGIHHREPGAAGALLLSDKIKAELIVDGVHLHPGMVELALKAKGKKKLLLVTDAIRAKCLGDGNYELAGQAVHVQQGKAQLKDGTLAGSILTMPQALKNLMEYTHCTLADAVMMSSYNPAVVLGIEGSKGSIEIGKDADLVVLNSSFDVEFTMKEGKVIFQRVSNQSTQHAELVNHHV